MPRGSQPVPDRDQGIAKLRRPAPILHGPLPQQPLTTYSASGRCRRFAIALSPALDFAVLRRRDGFMPRSMATETFKTPAGDNPMSRPATTCCRSWPRVRRCRGRSLRRRLGLAAARPSDVPFEALPSNTFRPKGRGFGKPHRNSALGVNPSPPRGQRPSSRGALSLEQKIAMANS